MLYVYTFTVYTCSPYVSDMGSNRVCPWFSARWQPSLTCCFVWARCAHGPHLKALPPWNRDPSPPGYLGPEKALQVYPVPRPFHQGTWSQKDWFRERWLLSLGLRFLGLPGPLSAGRSFGSSVSVDAIWEILDLAEAELWACFTSPECSKSCGSMYSSILWVVWVWVLHSLCYRSPSLVHIIRTWLLSPESRNLDPWPFNWILCLCLLLWTPTLRQ